MEKSLMDREQKINELLELMNIPEIESAIFHRLNLIKYEAEEEINLYMNLKKGFRLTAYSDMYIYQGKKRKEYPTYHFEVRRRSRNHWVLTAIEPAPLEDDDIDEIIPSDIIDRLGVSEISPEKIQTFKSEVQTASGDKSYEVHFAKYSDSHALGTIRQIKSWKRQGRKKRQASAENTASSSQKRLKVIKSGWNYKSRDDIENFKTLFYYMQKYPEVRKRLFGEFFTRIKPRLDSQVSQITSG